MFKKKKFLRIIALSVAVLVQFVAQSTVWGMEEETEEESERARTAVTTHSQILQLLKSHKQGVEYWKSLEKHPNHPTATNEIIRCQNSIKDCQEKLNKLEPFQYVQHNPTIEEVLYRSREQAPVTGTCPACQLAFEHLKYQDIYAYKLKFKEKHKLKKKEDLEIITNFMNRLEEETNKTQEKFLLLEKENNVLKHSFILFQQKHEEFQEDISEFKKCVTFLQEENKTIKKENK